MVTLLFAGTTPDDLVSAGLYTDLAMAFYAGAFRPTSVALVAMKLGAVDAGRRKRGRFATAETAEAAAEVWQTVVAEERMAAADAAQEEAEEEGNVEERNAENENPGQVWPSELLKGLASPWMGELQQARALPRPDLGMQRMGAANFRHADGQVGGPSGNCSKAEKHVSSLDKQQQGSDSISKLERLRRAQGFHHGRRRRMGWGQQGGAWTRDIPRSGRWVLLLLWWQLLQGNAAKTRQCRERLQGMTTRTTYM